VRARALWITTTALSSIAVLAPAAVADSSSGGASAPGSGSAPAQSSQSRTQSDTVAQGSSQSSTPSSSGTGGSAFVTPVRTSPGRLMVAGTRAKIVHGFAYAPSDAPLAVQYAIWAGNRIVGLPYVWGGGHQAFTASGYDCSGTVSYALHGGRLLSTPMDSSTLEGFGAAGAGRWITIFANGGHTYMDIAGIRLDTSAAEDPSGGKGPRWRPMRHDNSGYTVRHPVGL
jgi:cell wall-associated NlpC family hydrolase